MTNRVTVTPRGARRWTAGHPWVYQTDVVEEPATAEPGVVLVADARGHLLGQALYSPASEIRLRLLSRVVQEIDTAWWATRIRAAAARRRNIDATAYRLVHGEADGLPSLVVDRYDRYLSVQLLSAGLEARRGEILAALAQVIDPAGIVLRNDAPVRQYEGLPLEVEDISSYGETPEEVEVAEGEVRYRVALRSGQKTGAFLDQRDNRRRAAALARGRCLDVFSYQGAFALHLARGAEQVIAVDQSAEALARGRANAALNDIANIEWLEANAFDHLRELERGEARFDVVVLDPPPFARSRSRVERALAGYKEINLRAMRILAPGGQLLSFSCSYHVRRELFLAMLADAAADSGRILRLDEVLGQPSDHPEILTIPESGYLKGALLSALD